MYSKLITFASIFVVAFAECPGDTPCSGHGKCGKFDKCQCYRNWQGPHCGDRTCPFQTSWNQVETVTLSTGDKVQHKYTECSSKGSCNRKTGQCECYSGFTGSSCRRMMCEGEGACGGHGVCKTIETVASTYTGWDGEKIQQCVCDSGYEGDSCEKRICPHGDDPITTSTWDDASLVWENQVDDVQTLEVMTAAAGDNDEILLMYTDYRNKEWFTYPLKPKTMTKISIKEALEALPNHAVPSVVVTGDLDSTTSLGTFSITFSHHSNSGKQPRLQVYAGTGCDTSGCQPKYKGVTTSVEFKVLNTLNTGTTNEEFVSCSSRGQCDTEKGDCTCFKGYTGQACETQTIIV